MAGQAVGDVARVADSVEESVLGRALAPVSGLVDHEGIRAHTQVAAREHEGAVARSAGRNGLALVAVRQCAGDTLVVIFH